MPKKEKVNDEPTASFPSMYANQPAKKAFGPMAKIGLFLGVVVTVAAVGASGYFYKQLRQLQNNPTQVATQELTTVLEAVGKLIVLPTGEEPTLATVTDPDKLKEQAFFASAKKGDKVLIYTNAKKAILYDPVANKIVEVAPINIGSDTQAQPKVSGTSTDSSKK
jgi:hypothetical protein